MNFELCLRNSRGISITYCFYPVHPKINHFCVALSTNIFYKKLLYKKPVANFLAIYNKNTIGYYSHNNRKKCFRRVGGFVNITDPEGGPTVIDMIPEDGTAETKLPSPTG